MAQERRFSPGPSNVGEPKSVRDAYDTRWKAEKAEREAARQNARQGGSR